MKSGNDNLVVRQHDRLSCRLPAILRVAKEHADRVVLARTAGDGHRTVKVVAVDVSSGGLALESPIFFPKACRLEVRLLNPEQPDGPPLLETAIRIQRTAMLDRTPIYYLGGAFVTDSTPEHRSALDQLFNFLQRAQIAGKVGA